MPITAISMARNTLRNMRIKKFISLLSALILCTVLISPAYAVVSQSESFYVADYANVLSNTTEETIINYNGALEQQCQGAQIVVVTVDYLDGMYCDEYAYKLFNDWGVGSADYNNGMLLLLAVQENKCWLAYGLGLNSQLSSDDVDELLEDYFYDDFDAGKYDDAVTELFMQLLDWYDERYDSSTASAGEPVGNVPQNQYNTYNDNYYNYGSRFSLSDIIDIIFVAAFIIIILSGGRRGRGGRGGRGGGSWLPWMLYFNSRNRNRRPYNDRNDWPPRGGGFGGGPGGFGGGFGGGSGGFGGGSGRGGGGFSGGGGGRR